MPPRFCRLFRHTMLGAAAMAALGLSAPALAETDFSALSTAEERILRAELRDILAGLPHLLPAARQQPASPDAAARAAYADAVASDRARIARHAGALFAPDLPGFGAPDARHVIALFTRPDCPDCARAQADLRQLADAQDLRVTLLDLDTHADLAAALELDIAPFYVLPGMMLRGHVPAVVLTRYLSD